MLWVERLRSQIDQRFQDSDRPIETKVRIQEYHYNQHFGTQDARTEENTINLVQDFRLLSPCVIGSFVSGIGQRGRGVKQNVTVRNLSS